jgi:flagellin-like hook-associated protein FlgL
MSTINDMVIKIRTLVVQASNDTNAHDDTNLAQSDRVRLQDEINQLMDEIDATRNRTQFNTRNLIDGSLGSGSVAGTPGLIQAPGKGPAIPGVPNGGAVLQNVINGIANWNDDLATFNNNREQISRLFSGTSFGANHFRLGANLTPENINSSWTMPVGNTVGTAMINDAINASIRDALGIGANESFEAAWIGILEREGIAFRADGVTRSNTNAPTGSTTGLMATANGVYNLQDLLRLNVSQMRPTTALSSTGWTASQITAISNLQNTIINAIKGADLSGILEPVKGDSNIWGFRAGTNFFGLSNNDSPVAYTVTTGANFRAAETAMMQAVHTFLYNELGRPPTGLTLPLSTGDMFRAFTSAVFHLLGGQFTGNSTTRAHINNQTINGINVGANWASFFCTNVIVQAQGVSLGTAHMSFEMGQLRDRLSEAINTAVLAALGVKPGVAGEERPAGTPLWFHVGANVKGCTCPLRTWVPPPLTP